MVSTASATLHLACSTGRMVRIGPGHATEAFTTRAHPVPRIRAVSVIWDCRAATPRTGQVGENVMSNLTSLVSMRGGPSKGETPRGVVRVWASRPARCTKASLIRFRVAPESIRQSPDVSRQVNANNSCSRLVPCTEYSRLSSSQSSSVRAGRTHPLSSLVILSERVVGCAIEVDVLFKHGYELHSLVLSRGAFSPTSPVGVASSSPLLAGGAFPLLGGGTVIPPPP